MTKEEWDLICLLVDHGEQESPWSWSKDWPEAYQDRKKIDAVLDKFKAFVEGELDSI